jgi:hypothetical protein
MREVDMHSSRVRYDGAIRFTLVLLFAFGAGGCKKAFHEETVTFACRDEKLDVDPTDGTIPKAIYLCAGKTVTWNPNGHRFRVVFRKKSPFVDDKTVFDNDHPKSAGAKHAAQLIVYYYDMTIDGMLVDDPQVIGGGGH